MIKRLIAYINRGSMEKLGHAIEDDMELAGLLIEKIREEAGAIPDDVKARNFLSPAKYAEQSCKEKLARSRKSLEEVELHSAEKLRRAARADIRTLFDILLDLRRANASKPGEISRG